MHTPKQTSRRYERVYLPRQSSRLSKVMYTEGMNTVTVVNIKCGGCEKKITTSLEKAGLTNVTVDVANQTVSFDGDAAGGRKTLSSIGYPEAGTPEAESMLKKAHSYISCAIGRLG